MKTCSKCNENKELEQFNKRSASNDGLQSQCTPCRKAYKPESIHRSCQVCGTSLRGKRHGAKTCDARACKTRQAKLSKRKSRANLKEEVTIDPEENRLFLDDLSAVELNTVRTNRTSYKYEGLTEAEIQAFYLEDLY